MIDVNRRYKMFYDVPKNKVAKSACWFDVALWVVTFGRKGKTHVIAEDTTLRHVNCRCSMNPVNDKGNPSN